MGAEDLSLPSTGKGSLEDVTEESDLATSFFGWESIDILLLHPAAMRGTMALMVN